ncbi:hypothetical protein Slin15195_G122520 [Septoria linicola]|uniref:Uncharacterized protein n=1 Tax=Septoria linicola TaxID=215465 RepID=A0A9Q9B7Q0_9PEZI|nr:hypothetical protein Slin14017_G078720 [Septoria linicola]USW58933.1 hypothetical protein Slin15195_G122520 [Septoria linicola]
MQFLTLLTCAVPALASAIPQADTATLNPVTGLPADYTWAVENWHAGCSRGGCNYNFNITGAYEGLRPGFKAYCNGEDTGYYAPCEILDGTSTSGIPFVAASLRPNSGNGIATMSASLSFTDADSGVTYNISGWADSKYNAFVAPLQNFTVTPSQVTSVL